MLNISSKKYILLIAILGHLDKFLRATKNKKVPLPGIEPWPGWYAESLLEIDLNILIRKIAARLNFKIALISAY
jgi:hypothetical protein